MGKVFKIYVAVMLFIITLLLGALVGGLIYASVQVKDTATKASDKINSFNKDFNTLNKDLHSINDQLKTNSSKIVIP